MQHLKTVLRAVGFGVVFVAQAPHPAQAETIAGYVVLDRQDGTVLAEKNPDEAFIPASVLKLPTALAVLETLGPDHRFTTRLVHDGAIRNGVLKGDLVLIGGGDPALDSPALEAMAQALAAAGITRLEGRLLYDETALPRRAMIEFTQPPDAAYNPGLGGLSLDFNRFKVTLSNGVPVGADIPPDLMPAAFAMPPATPEVWLPVHDPGRFTARMFQWLAARHGVVLPLPEAGTAPAQAMELARHDSLPVAGILRQALIFSNNMVMDTLALAAARTALGRAVTLEEAGAWLTSRTKARTPGADWAGFVMPNGSGLTDDARMTPRQCAAIAYRAATGEKTADLLPPLRTAPFATRDERADARSPLRAKSGTISYARGLAGTLRARSGRDVVFCVLTTDKARREVYDAIPFARRQDDAVRNGARHWAQAAREIEETTVMSWFRRF